MIKKLQALVVTTTLVSGVANAALIAHYTFDETTGVTATDSSPSGANGTIGSNVTKGTPGVFGTSFTFNNDASQNGIVDMGNASTVFAAITTSQQVTISLWMKWGTGTGTRDTAVYLGRGGEDFRFVDVGTTSGGGVYGRTRNSATSSGGTVDQTRGTGLNNNTWHHVAYTADANADITQLYINGVLQSPATSTALSFPAFDNFEIGRLGRNSFTDGFAGSIDEVRIYDEILTGTLIAGLAVPEPASAALVGFGAVGLFLRRRK